MIRDHINLFLQRVIGSSADAKILLACSAGIDSMVMLQAFHSVYNNIAVAHVNYQLRGKHSDKESKFVESLCAQKGIPFYVYNCNQTDWQNKKKSIQEQAREIRYNFFRKICSEFNFEYISTAHNQNDSFETVILNLISGSGIQGLTGIAEFRNNIIRPMLNLSRIEIQQYANENNIQWIEDNSNKANKYKRNRIRHWVIPALQKTDADWANGMLRTIQNLTSTSEYIENQQEVFNDKHGLNPSYKKMSIDVSAFNKGDYFLLFNFLRNIKFTHDQCLNISRSSTEKSRLFESDNFTLVRKKNIVTINQHQINILYPITISGVGKYSIGTDMELHLTYETYTPEILEKVKKSSNKDIIIRSELIKFPLVVRPWEKGDRFHPFGMKGSKLISNYLIDLKINTFEKKHALILLAGETICWLIGFRMSKKFQALKEGEKIVYISVVKKDGYPF